MKTLLRALGICGLASAAMADPLLDRGEYLVQTVMACGNCHTPIGAYGPDLSQDLAGRVMEETPDLRFVAPNITPASRIAEWSDEELGRAIREGIRPDGSVIGPPMPFLAYRRISDDDLAAVIAYLRATPSVSSELPASKYPAPLPPSYGPPIESVSAPEPGVTPEYGDYLSALGHCMECHSPLTPTGPDWENGFARGGAEFHGPWGTSVAPNLTNHTDGLADHSDEEIKVMIAEGLRPDGTPMLPPMPYVYLGQMTDEDLDALVSYLRSLPGQTDP